MKPLVSVVIVTYNRVNYLLDCLSSIRKSTYKNYEIVLVDDGSEEDINYLAKEVDIYARVPHVGQSNARNTVMKLFRGEYFLVVDSDDLIEPTCIEKNLEAIQREGADLSFGDYYIINKFGQRFPGGGGYFICHEPTFEKAYNGDKGAPHGGSMGTRELLPWWQYDLSLKTSTDYDILLNLLTSKPNFKTVHVPEFLYTVRMHGGGQDAEAYTPDVIPTYSGVVMGEERKKTWEKLRKKYKKYYHG